MLVFDFGESQTPPAREPRTHLALKSIVLDQSDVERGAPVLSPLQLQPHGFTGACLQVVLLDGCIDGVPCHGTVGCPLPTWGNTRSLVIWGKQAEYEVVTYSIHVWVFYTAHESCQACSKPVLLPLTEQFLVIGAEELPWNKIFA